MIALPSLFSFFSLFHGAGFAECQYITRAHFSFGLHLRWAESTNLRRAEGSIEILSSFESGVLTIRVNEFPLLKVDADSKSLDVEASGVREAGIKLSEVLQIEGGRGFRGLVRNSESLARGLSEKGWRLTLYDKGSGILEAGRGVSRLTGYVHLNPLRLRRILESL